MKKTSTAAETPAATEKMETVQLHVFLRANTLVVCTSSVWERIAWIPGVSVTSGLGSKTRCFERRKLGFGQNTNYVQQDDARMKKNTNVAWQNVILFP